MTYLIDAHNTVGAGSVMVTRNFLQGLLHYELRDSFHVVLPDIKAFEDYKQLRKEKLRFTFVPQLRGLMKIGSSFFYNFIFFPLYAVAINPHCVFVMGNYSPVPWARKVVLMHTPYLVDDALYAAADIRMKIEEGIVRLLFRLTLLTTSAVVVQNDRMRDLFRAKYGDSMEIIVLPTPVSEIMGKQTDTDHAPASSEEKKILFVSRYYPHKNHDFLVELARSFAREFRERRMVFFVTLNPSLGSDVERLLADIREAGLEDVIMNIGEVPNDELVGHYREATALFFPSKSESFGLPLVEAMAWGLPVVVPDLTYAREVCAEAGVYYRDDDVNDAFRQLERICTNVVFRTTCAERSLSRSRVFPTPKQWAGDILALLRGERKDIS